MKNRRHDIERYLRGELSPNEMHALEREALNDPFLAEALEGIEQTGAEHFLNDVHKLNRSVKARLRQRQRTRRRSARLWLWTSGIAATLLIVGIAGFYTVTVLRQQSRLTAPQDMATREAPAHDSSRQETGPIAMDAPPSRSDQPAQSPPERLSPAPEGEQHKKATRGTEAEEANEQRQATPSVVDKRPQREMTSRIHEPPAARRSFAPPMITGTITGGSDTPMPGVVVEIAGSSTSVVTDQEGRYAIYSPKDTTLVYSLSDVEPIEIVAKPGSVVDLNLTEDMATLSKVAPSPETGSIRTAAPTMGKKQYMQYLDSAVICPTETLYREPNGRITVKFTVDANGQLSDIRVLKGIGYGCDEALINAIRNGPPWSPATRDDQPVAGEVELTYRHKGTSGDPQE